MNLALCLFHPFPTTLRGGSCPLLIPDENIEAQRGCRATPLVTGRAQIGAVSLWGSHRAGKGIHHCHSRPRVL